MVLILLLLLYNHDKLILNLNQKKIPRYLEEGWLFMGSFKVESVLGMTNAEILAQFIYKPA